MASLIGQARMVSAVLLWLSVAGYVALGQPGWLMLAVGLVACTYAFLAYNHRSASAKLNGNPSWHSVVAATVGVIAVIQSGGPALKSIGDGFLSVFSWLVNLPLAVIGTAIVVGLLVLIAVVFLSWIVSNLWSAIRSKD